MSYYVHHVPGRLRVRIPEIRNNPLLADEIREILDIPGIFELTMNEVTGSMVIIKSHCGAICRLAFKSTSAASRALRMRLRSISFNSSLGRI
jgi:hypothetical protein